MTFPRHGLPGRLVASDHEAAPGDAADGPPPEPTVTARQRFQAILQEWQDATSAFDDTVEAFIGDGVETAGGSWILSMSTTKTRAIDEARVRLRRAGAALDAALDDLRAP